MSENKAHLTYEKTYKIEKGDKVYSNLRKKGEWEGFYKLENEDHTFIIVAPTVFHSMKEILNLDTGGEVRVIKAPPEFWAEEQ